MQLTILILTITSTTNQAAFKWALPCTGGNPAQDGLQQRFAIAKDFASNDVNEEQDEEMDFVVKVSRLGDDSTWLRSVLASNLVRF